MCVYIMCVSECVCAIQVVGDVLSKMLVVGITDPGIYIYTTQSKTISSQ